MRKKNVLKYKNKKSFTQKVIDKINNVFSIKPTQKVFNAVHEIEEIDYKYLDRNLVKINRAMFNFAEINLTKNKFEGEMKYFVVIRLKATNNE